MSFLGITRIPGKLILSFGSSGNARYRFKVLTRNGNWRLTDFGWPVLLSWYDGKRGRSDEVREAGEQSGLKVI